MSTHPPGNSLAARQDAVADGGASLEEGVAALLARIGEEVAFNAAKGESAYRLGVHDGLRFAEDALAALLTRHGHAAAATDRPHDA